MMILTVTLNAALDKTYLFDGFRQEAVNQPERVLIRAGGKGVNAARVLYTLQEPVLATGLVGGRIGEWICDRLGAEGVPHAFHRLAAGESRTCMALLAGPGRAPTEINEAGPVISPLDFAGFEALYRTLLPRSRFVMLSGSMPPGLDGSHYLALMEAAHAAGLGVSLDTSGPALAQALAGGPDLVKPNRLEAEALLRTSIGPENLAGVIEAILARGARRLALSLAEAGAVVADRHEAWYLPAPPVLALNPIGSGDAFLSALVASLLKGLPLAEAGALAVAAGSANAAEAGPADCRLAAIRALHAQVIPLPLDEARRALAPHQRSLS